MLQYHVITLQRSCLSYLDVIQANMNAKKEINEIEPCMLAFFTRVRDSIVTRGRL